MTPIEIIDARLTELEAKREKFVQAGDMVFANQLWARMEELKTVKSMLKKTT